MKYYAVKQGRIPGIYTDWDSCQKQINGFSGALYKSFKDLNEAKIYLGQEVQKKRVDVEKISNNNNDGKTLIVYVDGSYSKELHQYGYGCVFIENGEIIHTISGKDGHPQYVDMRNVMGEITAAKIAVKYAMKNNYDTVKIYYDYEGIEKWATGAWKCNKPATGNYKKYMMESRKNIKIEFYKVKAHTGDVYNEMADKLAKKSLGMA